MSGDVLKDKSQVFALDDFEYKEVIVKQWGGLRVLVRSLTMEEGETVDDMQRDPKEVTESAARLLCAAVVHPDTKLPIFDESDIPKFLTRNRKPALRLFTEIMKLSRIGEEEIEAAGKGSAPTQDGASSSSSAEPSASPPQVN